MKGFSIGEAEVSTKHAGFIINKGQASAKNYLEVIKHDSKTVYDIHNVNLETEVRIIGED